MQRPSEDLIHAKINYLQIATETLGTRGSLLSIIIECSTLKVKCVMGDPDSREKMEMKHLFQSNRNSNSHSETRVNNRANHHYTVECISI